jgi:hypothetical protein
MTIKIMSNYTTQTTKLIGTSGNNGMIQWRAGSSQAEMKESCVKANCLFLTGGQFMDPHSGEIIPKDKVTESKGTITKDPIYKHEDERQLMKVDKCFSIFGTPMLSAYAWDIKYPERLGLGGLELAISEAPRKADRARGALVGNASTIMTCEELETVDKTIRSVVPHHILYDHAWVQNPWVLQYAVASCNNFKEVEKAIKHGASVASIVMPQNIINQYKGTRIGKHTLIQCPENTSDKINCINCGGKSGPLCDAQTRSNLVIMFKQHGGNSWSRSKNAQIRNIASNANKTDQKLEGLDKIKHKAKVKATLKELKEAIKASDRKTIVSIGKRAMGNVTKATAAKYIKFMELT